MASKDSDSGPAKKQKLDETTTCYICSEVYTDPKTLPCIHAFCLKCLQGTGHETRKGTGDEMPCPICGRMFKIPPEGLRGLGGLPKTFVSEKLIQESSVSDQSEESSISTSDACVEESEETDKLDYKSEPVAVQTIRTNAAENEKKAIVGLTILDKELFVLNGESSEAEVYDSTKLSLSRRWKLKELVDPMDIGACSINKCLYIIDYKGIYESKEILRVDSNGNLIKKWPTGDDYGEALSVTDEANVILSVFNKHRLNEYSPDGQLIRVINLSAKESIRYPNHAIKLANGHFLVSHGDRRDSLHRVCMVDEHGKLKKAFGGKPGSTIRQLYLPIHLAVDGNGFVTVADTNNRRVLLLDEDLEFKREILSNEKQSGLRDLRRVLLDESNDRLFVIDNIKETDTCREGRVLIYHFK